MTMSRSAMGVSWSRPSELSRCGAISTTFDLYYIRLLIDRVSETSTRHQPPHQTTGRRLLRHKPPLVAHHSSGRQPATTNGPFHRGGPLRRGPVSRKIEARPL